MLCIRRRTNAIAPLTSLSLAAFTPVGARGFAPETEIRLAGLSGKIRGMDAVSFGEGLKPLGSCIADLGGVSGAGFWISRIMSSIGEVRRGGEG